MTTQPVDLIEVIEVPDARWLAIDGDDLFFSITKRIHNRLHGMPGDGEDLSESDRHHYESVLAVQADQLVERIGPEDVVILHDPQTAGLVPHIRTHSAAVIWRCHVGINSPNAIARDTWSFLLPYVECADCYVFSRRPYAWSSLDERRTRVVAPSIDPFSLKNCMLEASSIDRILAAAGILRAGNDDAEYVRSDGHVVRVEHTALMLESEPIDGRISGSAASRSVRRHLRGRPHRPRSLRAGPVLSSRTASPEQ